MADSDTPQESEYSQVETSELIEEALSARPTLPQSWLETRIYERLYTSLSKYLDRPDLLFALSELRGEFLEGFTHTTPQKLHDVCSRCRLCDKVGHPATVPSWNVTDPDLMIVVENPTVITRHSEFLVTALKAAGFKSNRCMLTYMTRCAIEVKEIEPEFIANCTPYLHTEMTACNPKLVLLLGSKVWGAVTGDVTHKISDLEGEVTWFGMFPLLSGMSLAWYSYSADNSPNRGNGRFVDLLSTAYSFLYTSEKSRLSQTDEPKSESDVQ